MVGKCTKWQNNYWHHLNETRFSYKSKKVVMQMYLKKK